MCVLCLVGDRCCAGMLTPSVRACQVRVARGSVFQFREGRPRALRSPGHHEHTIGRRSKNGRSLAGHRAAGTVHHPARSNPLRSGSGIPRCHAPPRKPHTVGDCPPRFQPARSREHPARLPPSPGLGAGSRRTGLPPQPGRRPGGRPRRNAGSHDRRDKPLGEQQTAGIARKPPTSGRSTPGTGFAPQFAGSAVPTLDEAVRTIQASGTTAHRTQGRRCRHAGPPVARTRLAAVGGGAIVRLDFVKEAHALAPSSCWAPWARLRPGRTAAHGGGEGADAGVRPDHRRAGARLVVWNRQVDAATIALARERGLRVWVYTINDPAEAEALVCLGVEGSSPTIRRRSGHTCIRNRTNPARRRFGASSPPTRGSSREHFCRRSERRVRLPQELPEGVSGWRWWMIGGGCSGWRPETGPRRGHRSGPNAPLGVGWYRVEFGTRERPGLAWTTAAVLRRLTAPTPEDSPVCVDTATAWFARDDELKQRRFANLATLAGVNWIRDRLRWADLQPAPGALVTGRPPTTRRQRRSGRRG